MTAAALKDRAAEPLVMDDPRNDMLDAVERLAAAVITDPRGRAALDARLARVFDSAARPQSELALPEPAAVAPTETAVAEATAVVDDPLRQLSPMDLAALLTLLRDVRRSVRNNPDLIARTMMWRRRVLEALNGLDPVDNEVTS